MRRERCALDGLVKIIPTRMHDHRGYFSEVFSSGWFCENVADISFVQENESLSTSVGTVRGLHFQVAPFAQGKLVRCTAGRIFDVAVDLRIESPTYARWYGTELSANNGEQLWIPAGFAHGFATLEPNCVISYKVTAQYEPSCERGVLWNDPTIGISWPVMTDNIVISAKDKGQPTLAESSAGSSYRGLSKDGEN